MHEHVVYASQAKYLWNAQPLCGAYPKQSTCGMPAVAWHTQAGYCPRQCHPGTACEQTSLALRSLALLVLSHDRCRGPLPRCVCLRTHSVCIRTPLLLYGWPPLHHTSMAPSPLHYTTSPHAPPHHLHLHTPLHHITSISITPPHISSSPPHPPLIHTTP